MTLEATLQGLRVLDLSTNIAGPFAAMILGDLGADVVKVERPPAGDDTRMLPPQWHGQATVFLAVNRNKRSVLLDLKCAEGRTALLKLASGADIVIESFPPGVAAKLALSDAHLREVNPRLIVCAVSAFGSGPLGAKIPGYDALVQAVSGMMSFTGEPQGATVRLAPSLLDLTTGMWAALGIMGALVRRSAHSRGEHVQVALLDSAFTLMCHQVLAYLATGSPPVKLGSGAPSAVPYRVFRGSDGEFMLATATDAQFVRLCQALDLEHLAEEERFRTMERRLASRAELDDLLSRRFAVQSVETWIGKLAAAGLSCGRVNDLGGALEWPVTRERQLFISPDAAWPGGLPLVRLPIGEASPLMRRPPPKLGEHSIEILREAGYDPQTAARLSAPGP
jgi:crotonobetainyl-CoA:carnitine CoA-transferase CaiB-like acyl-CoA transferase